MILSAVFILSLSSLAMEVLLTRVFSVSQWNHLSFMVISIALFGFAASGTVANIFDNRKTGWEKKLSTTGSIRSLIFLYIGVAIVSFLIINNIPFDYFRLPLEPIQIFYLLVAYLVLALPFFFTGMMVTIAFVAYPDKSGYIYFASMAGAACGACLPAFSLPSLSEGRLMIVSALIPLILPAISFVGEIVTLKPQTAGPAKSPKKEVIIFVGILIAAFFLLTSAGDNMVKVKPSAYKAVGQLLQFPDTQITRAANDIRGRIERVKSPYIRFAPGLSLKYTRRLPEQDAIFRDGDNQFVLYHFNSSDDASFAKSTLTFAGYTLIEKPQEILLIQNGGGLAIACALASRASKITIIEQHPKVAQMIRTHYRLPVVTQSPRAFLAGSVRRYDIIQVENWGTSIPGSAALTQDHAFTVRAFTDYLAHLSERGVLIVSRKLLLPPADSIRLWSTAYEALRALKFKNPERHLALLRNWDSFTLIVSIQALKHGTRLIQFADRYNFDPVYLPVLTQNQINRYAIFARPFHFSEINRLTRAYRAEDDKAFFQSYLLDVAPQTDNRPFPARFLKWFHLPELYKSTGSRPYSLLMSGEIVIPVVFVEAFLISLFLLSFPFFAIKNRGPKLSISEAAYFLSVGAGFMFVELYFIKHFILIFGNPVISFTVVLSGILVFSALGGFWSQYMSYKEIKKALITLIVFLALIFVGLETVTYEILGLAEAVQYALAILILLPCGVLIGLPFPLGMRYLVKSSAKRAHAWTANGCTSVLTSILAAQIALSAGISYIIAGAVASYILAFVAVSNARIGKI
jgi:hypothetical protein